ncbi:MAG: helix-turn-helix transcriptional regulator [Balneola sp.]|nr:helix-turn-helix transcriptional regulator [Balneola sp.]MBO6651622.1 helix-turn-helix transcriptional regulator [Balneola sp.]MBO6710712.1 helix-turn-helix transcriptional regulator [Balneola sp.]MBO6799398.1 helix-turn-helix transcriptional regulator [Balneola sp.]MBO6869473.1 helix-turn-helix transcriptional regulator [Balneola sp.]
MTYRTDFEILLGQKIDLLRIEKGIKEHGDDWQDFLDDIPGFVHLNKKSGILVHYINETGIKETGFTNVELNEMGYKYQENHLDPYTMHVTIKSLVPFIERDNDNEIFTFSQGHRKRDEKDFDHIYTATKPLRGTDNLISYSLQIDKLDELSRKVGRVLGEYKFIHRYFLHYQSLTSREIEILTLIASGDTNRRISEKLYISKATVKQHRKHIKKKTECRNIVELINFAQAFDLI